MGVLFQNILKASFHGGIVIAVVLASRLLLKKAPKKYICLLWLLAALRLLMPFEIESSLRLQPDLKPSAPGYVQQEDISEDTIATYPASPAIPDHREFPDDVTIVVTPNAVTEETVRAVDYTLIFAWVWLSVAAGLLVYSALSYLRLRRRVGDAVIQSEGIWVSGRIESPFVMGFFRPRIYLTPDLEEKEREYVLAHEKSHIRRGDQWWKLLGFVVLAIHWLNPLVWLGYVLLCRDLEMACDETVVKEMAVAERKAYSAALLASSAKGQAIAACPVAFGEVSVKGRIRNVLSYRKPKFWIVLIALITIVVVAVCFLTTPPREEPQSGDASVAPPEEVYSEMWGITAYGEKASPTGIRFCFAQTDESIIGELIYGQAYTLEKWDGNQWTAVTPVIENGAFTMEGIFLPKNATTTVEIDWEWLYGTLSEGYYRIGKDVLRDRDTHTFYVNFGIGEGYGDHLADQTEEALQDAAIAAVSGRMFTYEKSGFGGEFTIRIFGDGTFTYYEGMLSSYIGIGTWRVEEDVLILMDTGLESYTRHFRFRVENGYLYYMTEASDAFTYVDVADGDRFVVSGRAAEEEVVRDQAFYEELFTRQTDGAYATMWVGHLYEAFYAEPEEFTRQLSRKFGEDPGKVREALTLMSYEWEWYEPERFGQMLEKLRNAADVDQAGVDLLYWYYWEGEYRALGGGQRVNVPDNGQDYLAAALEGCEILEGYHLQVSSGSMFRYTYVSCRVEDDPYITELYQGQGTFDENTYAFVLYVTFVPENDGAYAYSMAGNTWEYDGADPEIPEGALVYSRCGYVQRTEDGWLVEIVGTGW